MQQVLRFARQACLAALALALAACTTPYSMPQLEEVGKPIASNFEGIEYYARQADLRVVWVHGMCEHKASWAANREAVLLSAMGLPLSGDPILDPGRSRPYPVVRRHSVGTKTLELRYLIWSPLADGAKTLAKQTSADVDGKPLTRASLNATLKDNLINDCFSDAVVYGGPAGDPIRNWMRAQVCNALGGEIRTAKRCEIDDAAPRMRTIFVAESLGSKMLSDALLSIWDFPSSRSNRSRLAQRFSDVQTVFYLANQIPLLSAATYKSSAGVSTLSAADENPEGDLLKVLSDARSGMATISSVLPSDPLLFVAFSDPNDLLSYRLLKGSYVPDAVKVTNMFVSNDTTYFGLLERPDTAHCGYGWNPTVIGALIKGYHGRFEKVAVDVPHKCGLGEKED